MIFFIILAKSELLVSYAIIFNQQTIILCKNKIDTFDDLFSHMDKIENELNYLTKERQKARNQVRKYTTKEQKTKKVSITTFRILSNF